MTTRTNALLLAKLALLAVASPLAARAPQAPAALAPCPLLAAEIEAALEVQLEKPQISDMKYPGGRDIGCAFPVKGSATMIGVRQIWDPNGTVPAHSNHGGRQGEGEVIQVPGDPDGAQVRTGGSDGPRVELSYRRGKVRARVMAFGGTFREADMTQKLLQMRRVP